MKVQIRHQKREVEVAGRRRVREVLQELGINPESVLVIRGSQLLTHDAQVGDDETIELRPVVSGGAQSGQRTAARGPRGTSRMHRIVAERA